MQLPNKRASKRRPTRTTATAIATSLALLVPSLGRAQPPRLDVELIPIDPEIACDGEPEDCARLKQALYHYAKIPALLTAFWLLSDAYWYEQIRMADQLGRKDGEITAMREAGFSIWHVMGLAAITGVLCGVVGLVLGVIIAR